MAKSWRFGAAGIALCLAACSTNTSHPLTLKDPRTADAINAAVRYAAGYYHLKPGQCGSDAGFRYGVKQDGDRLIVSVEPPLPRTKINVVLREKGLTLIEARRAPPTTS